MTLTKPAGCFLQVVGLAVMVVGAVSCNAMVERQPTAGQLVWWTLFAFGALLMYLGGRPGIEAARARKEAAKAQRQPTQDQQRSAPNLKKCPYCAEEIRMEAIKCKHCGSDLSSTTT